MADNTRLGLPQGAGDLIRDIDKGGIKTQVVAIDIGGSGAESLATTTNPLPVSSAGVVSTLNSTALPLAGGATFTGTAEQNAHPDVMVSCKTDADGTLYADFSTDDGANWDTSVPMSISAGVGEFHTLVKGPRSCRFRFVNGSAAQSYLRLFVAYGVYRQPNSGLATPIQQDADAITTRTIGEELAIARGLFTGYSVVNKFGRNTDIDSGSVPEDVWNGGGTYAGFPTGAAEEFEAYSSSASDTGVLTFTYLASGTATEYSTATVTLNGTTPVATGVTGTRMHTAQYASGSSTGFNLGAITIRHKITTANVFCNMPIGRSQTNVCAYTVPSGHTAYIRRLFCRVIGAASGSVDGALWIRTNGGSPRLRRPFSAATADGFEEMPYAGLSVPAKSDITVRIGYASANNLDVIAGFDLILAKN